MATLGVVGLSWCEHAGWMVVLHDRAARRRLQITLRLEEALILGQTLAGRRTEYSALYQLVRCLIGREPPVARIVLRHAGRDRASTAVIVHSAHGVETFNTSTAIGIALAVTADVPLMADEALLDACGIDEAKEEAVSHSRAAEAGAPSLPPRPGGANRTTTPTHGVRPV